MYKDVRDVRGKRLCRYDPERRLIEIQRRGEKTVVDLTQYDDEESASERPESQGRR
jgi:hypothetical protein